MKRRGSLFMLAVIMGQFLSPLVAVADTLEKGQSTGDTSGLVQNTGDAAGDKQTAPPESSAETTETSEKEPQNKLEINDQTSLLTYDEKADGSDSDLLLLHGHFEGKDPAETLATIKLPESFVVDKNSLKGKVSVRDTEAETKAADDAAQVIAAAKAKGDTSAAEKAEQDAKKEILKEIGAYEVNDKNEVSLTFTDFTEALATDFQLELKGSYTRGPDVAEGEEAEKFEVSVGDVKVEVKVEAKKVEEDPSKQSTTNGQPVQVPEQANSQITTFGVRANTPVKGTLNEAMPKDSVLIGLKFTDPSTNQEIDPNDSMALGTKVQFDMHLDFTQMTTHILQKGDTYTFQLPDAIPPTQFVTKDLTDEDGKVFGQYSIDKSGLVTITITNPDTKKASVSFNGKISGDADTKPGENTIVYPTNQDIPGPKIIIKPAVDGAISKSGVPDRTQNPTKAIWTVDFNRTYDKLENPQIMENFPAEVENPVVDKIIPITLNLDGEDITPTGDQAPAALVPGQDYDVDADGNVTFKDAYANISQPYRVIYSTDIKEDAKGDGKSAKQLTLKNTATQVSKGRPDLPAEATMTAGYKGMLDKQQVGGYDQKNQMYSWVIHYNYGQKAIDADSIINDQATNMTVDPNNPPLVYPVTIDPTTGNTTTSNVALDSNYYYIKYSNNNSTFTINFTQAYLDAYADAHPDDPTPREAFDVKYKTKVDKIVDGKITVDNKVNTENVPPTGPGTRKPPQNNIIKRNAKFDPSKNMAEWNIDINQQQYKMKNMVITDWSDAAKAKNMLVPRTVNDRDEEGNHVGVILTDATTGTTLTQGTDYDLVFYSDKDGTVVENDPLTNGYYTFKVILKGSDYATTDHKLHLQYYTELNLHTANADPSYKYDNHARINWNDGDTGEPYSSEGSTTYTPNTGQANQGVKGGVYNPQTKTITWRMIVNYNNYKTPGISIDDKLVGNQKYIPGSLKIERGTVTAAAINPDKNGVVDPTKVFVKNNDVKVYDTDPAGYETYADGSSYVHFDVNENDTVTNNNLKFYLGEMREEGDLDPKHPENNVPDTKYKTPFPNWNASTTGNARKNVFMITYETTVDGHVINTSTETNHADIVVNLDPQELDGKVTIQYSNESAVKKGVYNEATGLIDWEIWLNRNQSTLLAPVLTDTPSDNQIILKDTFKVYKTNVATDGTVSVDAVAANELDSAQYSFELKTDTATMKQDMTIDFSNIDEPGGSKGTMKLPYYITYSARPNFDDPTEEVSNDLKLKTAGTETGVPPAPFKDDFTIDNTTGNAIGGKGTIEIAKSGLTGSMPGAKFELWRHFTGGGIADQFIAEGTTDSEGKLTFGKITYTDSIKGHPFVYLLKEISSPFGYTLMEDMEISVTQNTTPIQLKIKNEPSLKIFKLDEMGSNIGGATMVLSSLDDADQSDITFVTDKSKPYDVDLNSLVKDMPNSATWRFEVKETKAPLDSNNNPAYILNDKVIRFVVVSDDSGNKKVYKTDNKFIFDADTDEIDTNKPVTKNDLFITNYRGSATFSKSIDGGKPGTGAVFGAFMGNNLTPTSQGTADMNGNVLIENLPPGNYSIKEITPAPGTYLTDKTLTVTIAAQGGDQEPAPVTAVTNSGASNIVNYPGKIEFIKVGKESFSADARQVPLNGAKFELVNKDGKTIKIDGSLTTDSSQVITLTSQSVNGRDGVIQYSGFYPGKTYYLKEIEAPDYSGSIGGSNGKYIFSSDLFSFTMPPADSDHYVNESNKDVPILGGNDDYIIWNFLSTAYFTKQAMMDGQAPANQGGAYFELLYGGTTAQPDYVTTSQDKAMLDRGAVKVTVAGEDRYYFRASTDPTNLGKVTVGDLNPGHYQFKEVIPVENYVKSNGVLEFEIADSTTGLTNPTVDLDTTSEWKDENTKIPLGDQHLVNYTGIVKFTKKVFTGDQTELANGGKFNIYRVGPTGPESTPVNGNTPIESVNGVVRYFGLGLGDYVLKEVEAPNDDYLIDPNGVKFTIGTQNISTDADPNNQIVYEPLKTQPLERDQSINNYQARVYFNKTDASGKRKLPGAEFRLLVKQGRDYVPMNPAISVVADPNGKVMTPNLAPGEYRLEETLAPFKDQAKNERYLLNTTPIDFTIPKVIDGAWRLNLSDNVYEKQLTDFVNYLGGVQLVKIDGDDITTGLGGALFALYKDGVQNPIQTGLPTEADGTLKVENLAPGRYYFVETNAPKGFVANSNYKGYFEITDKFKGDPGLVTPSDNSQLTVKNFKGNAEFTKLNANDEGLPGATFDLYNADQNGNKTGKAVDENLTTGPDGKLEITGLAPGSYVLVETNPPLGYIQDTRETKVFKIEDKIGYNNDGSVPTVTTYVDGTALSMVNYKGDAQIIKQDGDGGVLQKAIFELRRKNSDEVLQTVTSDENGLVNFTGLTPGTYVATETTAPTGYIRNTKPVTFTINKTYDSKDSDEADKDGKPILVTIDDSNNKMIVTNITGSAQLIKTDAKNNKLAGASFNVFKESDDPTTATPINAAPITSKGDGIIRIDDLAPGKYFFYEVAVDGGYGLNTTKVPFEIPEATDQDEVLITKDLSQNDMQLKNYKASIELTKYGLNHLQTPSPATTLEGATFTLSKVDDQGGLSDPVTLLTNQLGVVRFDDLEAGQKYQLQEVKAPGGFQVNDRIFTVTVPKVITSDLVIREDDSNTPLKLNDYKGFAKLTKLDGAGKQMTAAQLANAEFKVYSAEPGLNYGTPVTGTIKVNPADGYIYAYDLPVGKYFFKETKAPTGFLLNNNATQVFEIPAISQSQDPVEVMQDPTDPTKTVPLTLQNYQGSAQLKKTDEAGADLPGATFALYAKPDDKTPIAGIAPVISDQNGLVTFKNLAPGTYTAKETQAAPGGFIQSEKSFTFTIADNADGEPAMMNLGTIINVKGGAVLQKVNEDNVGLNGAEFDVYKTVANGQPTKVNQTPLKSQTVDGKDGIVQIGDLAPGDYYFQEITRPGAYKLNNTPVDFTIPETTESEEAVIKTGLSLIDYQGELKFTKQDADGKTLAGAEFTIYDDQKSPVGTPQESNGKGEVWFKNLAPGSYTVKETLAAPGHQQLTQEIPFVISDTGSATETVTIKSQGAANDGVVVNYQGSVQLTKKDGDTPANTLSGAIFTLYQNGKEYRKNLVVGSNGILEVNKLEPGTYYFQETTAVDGYILNTEPSKEFTISPTADAAQLETVEVLNYRGKVELEKNGVTTQDGKEVTAALDGAEFKITSQFKPTITQTAVATGGKVNFENLAPGKYTIEETKAADGYIRSTKTFDVTVEAEEAGQPTVIDAGSLNNVKGSATLKKTDEDGKALPNAIFTVYHADDSVAQADLTSDANGNVTVANLAPGDYYFKETKQPAGYSLNPTEYPFTIPAETDSETTVAVKPTPDTAVNFKGNIQLQKNDEDDKGLAGAEFTLTDANGAAVKATSDKDGKVNFTDLAPGDYTLQETAAAKDHQLNDKIFNVTIPAEADKTVLITEDKTGAKLELTNYKGKALLTKEDTKGNKLAGAEFSVYLATDQKNAIKENLTTDEDGEMLVKDLAPGTYVFKETKAPEGYLLNTEASKPFTIDAVAQTSTTVVKYTDDSDLIFTNYQGEVQLEKQDADGKPLPGAEFMITLADDKDAPEVKATSDKDGKVTFTDLAPGKYVISETKAADGFIRSEKTFTVVIEDEAKGKPDVVKVDTKGNSLTLKNVKGSAILKKTAEDTKVLLPGAEFGVYNEKDEEVAKATSTAEGKVQVDNLAPGKYYFKETKQPDGYLLNPDKRGFEIPDSTKQETPVVVENDDLQLQNFKGRAQVEKVSETGDKLQGAEFTLYQADGTTEIEKQISDKDGKALFENLAPGKYVVKETKAPADYQLNPTALNFEIPAETDKKIIIDKGSDGKALQVTDFQGNATLKKQDVNGKPLAGAEFAIFSATDQDTAVQENLVADKDGLVKVTDLAPGTYVFKETKAPAGYLLNTAVTKPFTIKATAAESETITNFDDGSEMTMVNYQGKVKLMKYDGNEKTLADAEFTLTKVDDEKDVRTAKSLTDGGVTFENLAPGKYTLKETKAPQGYIRSTKEFTFEIPAKAEGEPEIVLTDVAGKELKLINVTGTAILEKTDENGKALADAVFTVYTEAGDPVKDGTSDAAGKVTVTDLAPGKYYFQETKQPDGYQLNSDKIDFEIPATTDGETPVIVNTKDMTLKNFKGRAEITKVDEAGSVLAGAEFTLLDEKGETITALTSDDKGKVLFEGLAPGNYQVKETKAPQGYQLNPTVLKLVIPEAADTAVVITEDVAGQPLQLTNFQGQAQLQKTSEDGKPLAGAVFAVYEADHQETAVQSDLVADKDGLVHVTGLAPGKYVFKETKAAAGYLLNNNASEVFTIAAEAAEAQVVKAADSGKDLAVINYQGSAQLIKTDQTGSRKLKDAVFKLVGENGGTVASHLVTDANGVVTVNGLAPGTYSFVETQAPTGYLLDATPVTFTIKTAADGKPEMVTVTKRNTSVPPTTRYPKTGFTQNIWLAPAGVGVLGIAEFIQRKRRKQK